MFGFFLLLLLAAPFFGLGFYRSWKVAAAFVLGFGLLSALYAYGQMTAAADDAVAHEWGAQAAPGFFFWLAVVFAGAFALGLGTRVGLERIRGIRRTLDGEIRE